MTAFWVAAQGFGASAGLILAIGAQNALVLKEGIRGGFVGPVVLVCILSEFVLIFAGVAGFGVLVEQAPWLTPAMKILGAIFVFGYGVLSFRSAWRGGSAQELREGGFGTATAAVSTALAITWLNPHVYLDTVVLLGAIAASFGELRWMFGIGAFTASALFFLILGYGAQLVAPLFARPLAWRVLDGIIGAVMCIIAIGLILSL